MSIHTIGDSHSHTGWSGIVSHHLGPKLCYSFGRDKLAFCDIRNMNIKDEDTVVFSFGEIDCRCHIHKYITETKTYEEIINDIVYNYFESIKLNIITSGIKLKNVCVYNIVPPIQKHNTPECPSQPFLGTDEERKLYVLYFNKKLKEKCLENNYIFFDIYNKYIDENGFLRKDLSDGKVHVGNGVHITNFINENLISSNKKLHLFSYGTDKSRMELLEKTARIKNIPIRIIYEPQSEFKGYVNKIFKIKEVISNIPPNDLVCFMDAYDVLCFASSEQEIMDKFHFYDCDLLMGAELNSYPYGYDDKYPETSHSTNYKYINSGGFIGYQSAIMELYNWKSEDEIIHICSDGGDQTYFIQYYLEHYNSVLNHKRCKMDYQPLVFQNMFLASWYDFIIQNGRLYNTVLKTYPCFIHFNGESWKIDNNENIMNVFVDNLEKSSVNTQEIFNFNAYHKCTWPNGTILSQLRN